MPFRSKKQQRFMFATIPAIAKEWANKTDFSKLPEKARKKKKKKDKGDVHDVFQGKKSLEAHGDKLAQALLYADVFLAYAVS